MLEVAVIGSGFMGRMHAEAARRAGARVRGVGASSPERADAARAALGVDRVYLSPEEVAADPAVDVVHVCTPNATHLAYAEAALGAGKHVVCEKPLGVSLEEARRLTQLAAASPELIATVPFVYRYYPMVREAAARVAAGELGEIRLLHGSYLQDWLADPRAWNWRVDAAQGGRSRAFADIGVHWCDLAEFVSGERITRLTARLSTPASVYTDNGDSPSPVRTTEDAATVMFETAGGSRGTVIVSQISFGHKNRLILEVDGGLGSVQFDQERPDLLLFSHGEHTELLRQGSPRNSSAAQALSLVPEGHPQGYADCFALFVRDTYAAIFGEARDGVPTFSDGLRAAELVDAVLESAHGARWVEVPSASRQRTEAL